MAIKTVCTPWAGRKRVFINPQKYKAVFFLMKLENRSQNKVVREKNKVVTKQDNVIYNFRSGTLLGDESLGCALKFGWLQSYRYDLQTN